MAKYSEFFGLTEAAKQEQLVLQNATSCRTPLVSTHLYFEQMRRMRGCDALKDVQLADSNRFHIDNNNQSNTGQMPVQLHPRLADMTYSHLPELPHTTDWLVSDQWQTGPFMSPSSLRSQSASGRRLTANSGQSHVDYRPAPWLRRNNHADQAELRLLVEQSRVRQLQRIRARLRQCPTRPDGILARLARCFQEFCEKALRNHQVTCMYFDDFKSLTGTIKVNSR
jgi:hypothetical protein